ncbi:MAG: hypothetical protein WCG25_07755 [bacterium]
MSTTLHHKATKVLYVYRRSFQVACNEIANIALRYKIAKDNSKTCKITIQSA